MRATHVDVGRVGKVWSEVLAHLPMEDGTGDEQDNAYHHQESGEQEAETHSPASIIPANT